MTVRSLTGRRRYILFEMENHGEPPMGLVVSTIRKEMSRNDLDPREMRMRIMFFEHGYGIVRCLHMYQNRVIEVLNSTSVGGYQVSTFRTSGTLKTLKVWLREKKGIIVPGKQRGGKADRKSDG